MIRNEPRQRKKIGSQNGLNIFSRLKGKTKLKTITPKQRKRNNTWREVTEQRIAEEGGICQWCGKPGSRNALWDFLSGHHIIKRRYGNDNPSNNYICHYHSCHQFIEDHGIDVRIYPNKLAWEKKCFIKKI